MSEQKKGVHRKLVISYYSISKDEYIPIEDMAHEHLVNVIYKSVEQGDQYLANFKVRDIKSQAFDYATLDIGVVLNVTRLTGVPHYILGWGSYWCTWDCSYNASVLWWRWHH